MVNTNARQQNDEPCQTGCPALLLVFSEQEGGCECYCVRGPVPEIRPQF